MIALGDIALPFNYSPLVESHAKILENDIVIANLEGSIVENPLPLFSNVTLYNQIGVLDFLKSLNVRMVSLANNHIFDVDVPILTTKKGCPSMELYQLGLGRI